MTYGLRIRSDSGWMVDQMVDQTKRSFIYTMIMNHPALESDSAFLNHPAFVHHSAFGFIRLL